MTDAVSLGPIRSIPGRACFGPGRIRHRLTALGIWLQAVDPPLAAPLVVICSVASQALTFPRIWSTIDFSHLRPFLVGGLIGVPIGVWLLGEVDPRAFKLAIGLFLIIYSTVMLFGNYAPQILWGGDVADGMIGLGGGILGGLAGLSGPLPTMWAAVRGWNKKIRRAIFQGFNFPILCGALVIYALYGFLNAEVWRLALIALPGTLVGAWIGSEIYRRASDVGFHRMVLCILALSGVTLLMTTGFG